ncbi:MAG: protein-ribulosamine 3-kinase [Paraglaciecola sp.]|jgi:protein-ribulosamine 3-kinase
MLGDDLLPFFESALFKSTGLDLAIENYQPVTGGSINNAVKLVTKSSNFFLKWNEHHDVGDLFEKEIYGLNELSKGPIKTPKVLGEGKVFDKSFLLLEYIERGIPPAYFWERFAEQLAEQHQSTADGFGFHHDNHIGILRQKNDSKQTWLEFFIQNRLEVQLGLALYNGLVTNQFVDQFRGIYMHLADIFPIEPPALLHGDLWSGNFICSTEGDPYYFDPSIYYGHREMELAFTQLFGSFDVSFYHHYDSIFPLVEGANQRIDIYNLYPLLVHVNLFGSSYLTGIKEIIKRFN